METHSHYNHLHYAFKMLHAIDSLYHGGIVFSLFKIDASHGRIQG
jgi:hypothetical protein